MKMGIHIARRRLMMLVVIFPSLFYILHFPFFMMVTYSYEELPQSIRLIQKDLPLSAVSNETGPPKKRIILEGKGPNITDILIAKKMGGLLNEMDKYRQLMKDALVKAEEAQEKNAKAKKKKKIGNGLDSDWTKDIKRQFDMKNITNFYYTLTMDVVNPYHFKYIINNEVICSQDNHDLTYLLYVHSAPGNQKLRNNIRQTWGQPNLFPQFPSRTVFFVGRVIEKDGMKQLALEEEARKYKDIVQLDFVDAYRNLTYKGMGAMRWISTYCPNTKYIFKSDDDVYVNMPVFLHRMTHEFANKTRFLMGHIFKFPSLHVQRPGKLCQKWCIPFDILPGLDHYPTFSSGSFYVYTQDVAEELFEMATRTPFFWVDDVYLTGIIASRIDGLLHIDIARAYRFNLAAYKESLLKGVKPLTVTLTKDQVSLWKYHLPLINGTWLNILGQERQQQLIKEADQLK